MLQCESGPGIGQHSFNVILITDLCDLINDDLDVETMKIYH